MNGRQNAVASGCGRRFVLIAAALAGALCAPRFGAAQQRVLGVDVSYWNRGSSSPTANGITQAAWNTAYNTPNANGYTRQFAFVRATRGGTTGLGQTSGTPSPGGSQETLSRRYDDPEFLRTMTRATTAGLFAGPYHFGRPDVAGNTGADEADHFIEYASAYMRPGYLMPVFDLEAGSGSNALAQFAVDFSNRLYARMQIRPAIYINGNYSSILQGASASLRNQLAQPVGSSPTVVGPAYPMLWNARYSDNNDPEAIPVQTGSPKTTYTTLSSYYGPWDDYGISDPWSFWQYASTVSVPGISSIDPDIDGNVAHGDIEYVKNYLVPALWWHDASGDWSTMTNWNSGQPLSTFNPNDLDNPPAPYVPHVGAGQTTPFTGYTLPVPRLPGTAGSGPAATSGIHDTVILERPNADITVTLSSGTYNIRKLYVRETLDIIGGSLTINYDPTYRPDNSSTVLHGGPLSAQFSGPVSLGGNGSLSVHTLQVDATRTFTLAGSTGTLTFNRIHLMPHNSTPAKLLVSGDVNIQPLANATATVANGAGAGSSGLIDLGGGTRAFNVGNGAAAVDLSVDVPITNGGLTKSGPGTMRLGGNSLFAGPVTVNGGTLQYGHASGLPASALVTVNNGGTLHMNGISDTIAGLASAAGHTTGLITQGAASLTLNSAAGVHDYGGSIDGTGSFVKDGGYMQILSGDNHFGPVTVNAGTLLLNGTNTTDAVTVNGGMLGGAGSVSGTVSINQGAMISPGTSVGTLSVGALTLQSSSILDFELGNPGVGDRINVDGLLTILGGSIQLTDVGGLGPGVYDLVSYGSLSGDVASLGTPIGPGDFNYSLVDDGTKISLHVAAIALGLPGDYNDDGVVDAADYVVWRRFQNTPTNLPNDTTPGTVGQEDYDVWMANFGATDLASGAVIPGSVVPEPASIALACLAGVVVATARTRRPTAGPSSASV